MSGKILSWIRNKPLSCSSLVKYIFSDNFFFNIEFNLDQFVSRLALLCRHLCTMCPLNGWWVLSALRMQNISWGWKIGMSGEGEIQIQPSPSAKHVIGAIRTALSGMWLFTHSIMIRQVWNPWCRMRASSRDCGTQHGDSCHSNYQRHLEALTLQSWASNLRGPVQK